MKAVVRSGRCELGITLRASAGGRHRVIVIFLHPMLSLSSGYCWACLWACSCYFCGWSQFTYLYARSYIFWPELRQARPGKLPQSILIVLDSLFQKSSLPSLAGGAMMLLHCLIVSAASFREHNAQCPASPLKSAFSSLLRSFHMITQALKVALHALILFCKLNSILCLLYPGLLTILVLLTDIISHRFNHKQTNMTCGGKRSPTFFFVTVSASFHMNVIASFNIYSLLDSWVIYNNNNNNNNNIYSTAIGLEPGGRGL